MRARGTVIDVRGPVAVVRIRRPPACGGCGACPADRPAGPTVEADGATCPGVGETVEIDIGGGRSIRAASAIFLLPLLGLAAGLAAGRRLAGSDGAGLAAGTAGILAVYLALGVYDRRVGRRGGMRPRIVRVLGGADRRG
ncbi:MAG: SoxR reducing system RseC family protein [bacterium]|nr:SoxR reducing system RseC family protein [bacterium]